MPNQTVQIRWWAVRGFQRDYLRRLIRWQGLNFVLTPDSIIYAVQQTIIWCSETGSPTVPRLGVDMDDAAIEAVRDETFRLRGMFWHSDDGAFADF